MYLIILKICFPSMLDEIYEYCNYIEGLGYFCRSVSRASILDEKKQIIDHSHLIFFTELSIKRLIISENLLIDGTFTYPKGYYQTIIIMFYDPIIFKMIPGIFIAIKIKHNRDTQQFLNLLGIIFINTLPTT